MIDIDRKIDSWKNQLLDLGKRNRLINYRDSKRSNLRITQPTLSALWKHFVVSEKPLIFPYVPDITDEEEQFTSGSTKIQQKSPIFDDGSSDVLTNQSPIERQKTLRSIRNKARTILEEQGVNVLYLSFGFLKWYEDEHSKQELLSPLILVPVSITLENITSPFVLDLYEDDIILNPTLAYKLENDYGIKLPSFDETEEIENYFVALEKIVSGNHWNVKREIGLSLFSFLKINMYEDLEKNRDRIKSNSVIQALCGENNNLDGNILTEIENFDHDKSTNPTDIFQVVDADASQEDAILCAKRGLSFILQGPPGTGKSQTITNIIAECLADGKKVLFVSEKMAALEVVYKRLSNAGLKDFCLTLHSSKANKKEILEQLREALNLSRKKAELSDEVFQQLNKLKADRDELNAYSEEIHTKIEPLNKSIYEVNGQLANLQEYDDIIFNLNKVDKISSQTFSEYISLLTRFSDTIGKMTGNYKSNPWYGSNVPFLSHELRHDISSILEILIPQCLEFSSLFSDLYDELNISLEPTYKNIEITISILKLASTSPVIPYFWITNPESETFDKEITHTQETMNQAHNLLAQYNIILDKLASQGFTIENDLKLPQNTKDLDKHLSFFRDAIDDNKCFKKWSTLEDIDLVENPLKESKEQISNYNKIRNNILNDFEEGIFEINYKEIILRFRTEYTSIFKVFKNQYKKDKKSIQAHMKKIVKKIDDAIVIDVTNNLSELGTIENWFKEKNSLLDEIFFEHNCGVKTNVQAIEVAIEHFNLIKECISILEHINKLFIEIEKNENLLQSHYDFLYEGLVTDWESIHTKLDWANEFRKLISNYPVDLQFIKNVCSEKEKIERCGYYHNLLSEKFVNFSTNFKWYSSLFNKEEAETISMLTMYQLADRCELCINGQSLLEEWIDFRMTREKCTQTELKEYVNYIEQNDVDKNNIVPIFKKRFYRLWLDAILPQYPAVMNFRRRTHEITTKEFSKLDILQFDIAQARIRQKLISSLPSVDKFLKGNDELSVLRRELNKRQKIMPIRKLFKEIPNLLMVLKPCLMMSPLSVSLFLESEIYEFDTVIFDEASQVRTENAIGAIFRGKQVIIAGDSKQLPPTNFFVSTTSDTDFDVEDENDESNDIGAYESILDEAALLPERTLLWHYRSKQEQLIAFSNAKIYHNNLITFPSNVEKANDNGVEYIYVKDGIYYRGERKGNTVEAKRVAELVFEHFEKFPDRSLGVIAFGEVQQLAIDNELRRMRLIKPRFEYFFKEDKNESFFVKNLENVQGDERDTIIFSIGYAKPPVGEMHMNFGPLSRVGGERRLNVAITRAKYNVKLVGSILPTDIITERITTDGPKLLRSYIEFAIHGPSAILNETSESDIIQHDSPFEKAVFNFLDRKGYKLKTQVGCSGYRIDMAVKHPTVSGKYVLGIECDGASYHSARTARERDRLRQSVLEDMGWTIYRIWSTDWIKDPITEGRKLLKTVDKAISNFVVDDLSGDKIIKHSKEDKNVNINSNNNNKQDEKNNSQYLIVKDKDTNNPYGFIKYEPVNFDDFLKKKTQLTTTDIKNCIRKIIANEFPIHYEILCQKLAPLLGRKKVTIVVKREVDLALSKMKSECKVRNGFIYPVPMKKIQVKYPNNRKIDYVSTEELAEAMWIIAKKSVGSTKDSLIQKVANSYGYNRMSENILLAMQKAYNSLLRRKRIQKIEGKIVVK